MFIKELMEKYPDAKFILTLRDPAKWYDSVYETIFKFSKVNGLNYMAAAVPASSAHWCPDFAHYQIVLTCNSKLLDRCRCSA